MRHHMGVRLSFLCYPLEDPVSLPERSRKPVLPRRTAAVAAAFALVAGTLALSANGAKATVAPPGGAGGSTHATAPGGTHWAITVTGKKVRVPKPKFVRTPLHPEKITHPGRDYMGSTVASHFKKGHV